VEIQPDRLEAPGYHQESQHSIPGGAMKRKMTVPILAVTLTIDTASAGAGEWYFSSILLGDGSKTAFTYTLNGSKLTTNMFYETSDTAYTYTMQ
jgi:hypothetical protein